MPASHIVYVALSVDSEDAANDLVRDLRQELYQEHPWIPGGALLEVSKIEVQDPVEVHASTGS